MEFNEKLKYVRGVLLISQKELAELLNLSFCTINRLENGKHKPNFITKKKLEKLCLEKSIKIGEDND